MEEHNKINILILVRIVCSFNINGSKSAVNKHGIVKDFFEAKNTIIKFSSNVLNKIKDGSIPVDLLNEELDELDMQFKNLNIEIKDDNSILCGYKQCLNAIDATYHKDGRYGLVIADKVILRYTVEYIFPHIDEYFYELPNYKELN